MLKLEQKYGYEGPLPKIKGGEAFKQVAEKHCPNDSLEQQAFVVEARQPNKKSPPRASLTGLEARRRKQLYALRGRAKMYGMEIPGLVLSHGTYDKSFLALREVYLKFMEARRERLGIVWGKYKRRPTNVKLL